MKVYRCYTEKKTGYNVEARGVLSELKNSLGIRSLDGLRIINRYDIQGISDEVYAQARDIVFSEPQVDNCFDEELPEPGGKYSMLIVEPLPGQFDQRADSCAQCIQMLTCGDRPDVASARVYILYGELTEKDMAKIRGYLINPVEARETSAEKPETLKTVHPEPEPVPVIDGFTEADDKELEKILDGYGLAMDLDDLRFMQEYFQKQEKRNPTVSELKVIDTYWSDHCRHTTFGTHIDRVEIEDREVQEAYGRHLDIRQEVYGEAADTKPCTLMDLGTIGTKVLKKRGFLKNIDQSEEINACSIHIDVDVDGTNQDWLLMFKNETHNHPTEIEPFGGAATCIGGAIRDPLSGRAYVYQAMRVTGAGDPTGPIEDTIKGKLPQKKLTVTAAQGYSSYGNQIGLATGLVHEVYHPGYVAKRMEVGAVVGAVRADNVVRERPAPGDKIILLGGRTGRDGIGGATGSSKTHNEKSLATMASEVQKGNAPEERKIQRLFRKPEVTHIIKRCNDFGAGGVSVAIGELADGLSIDLSKVRKKYEGLNGTEIAISESQERMAVVVAAENEKKFISMATAENLEAYCVAEVTEEPRMVMYLDGVKTVDLSREFLSSNGASKHTEVKVPKLGRYKGIETSGCVNERIRNVLGDLRCCSQRGLGERFDGSIGAGTVLMPLGGKTQLTPVQAMAAMIPVQDGETTTCSVMAYGFDPYMSEANTYEGAKNAVIMSMAKLTAAGCDPDLVYLSFQEYFEKLRKEPERWGKPFSALLGALDAQVGLGAAAIGGKDSMSGSFMDMDVPPTLISFAIAPCNAEKVISPEFKAPGNRVYLFRVPDELNGIKTVWKKINALQGIKSAWALEAGGVIEGIFKMAVGNMIGFRAEEGIAADEFFEFQAGAIIAEADRELPDAKLLGFTTEEQSIIIAGEKSELSELLNIWEGRLESVFPANAISEGTAEKISWEKPLVLVAKESFGRPKAVITAFPGTNCEEDTARAVRRAGGKAEIVIVKNLTPGLLEESVDCVEKAIRSSQMIILPGGFSGGDEPDGSAKFIAAFFRNPKIKDAVHDLLQNRDGLMMGICNGFQALIKLGLVPYGEIRDMDDMCPTLTYNTIGRHQSKYVYTRIASVNSPWLVRCTVGDVYAVPVSHGEGRFVASGDMISSLAANGQIATQYSDIYGNPSMDIAFNPNGSMMAVEGILSPDGRIFGKMGHTERYGTFTGKNIYGIKFQPLFEGGVDYFK